MGSPQHLRSKYGQGYSVTISLRKSQETNSGYVEAVQAAVQQRLPSSVLKDYHQSLLLYQVTDQKEKWSVIFSTMSSLNDQFDFEDYYVSDTTLENVNTLSTVHFAKRLIFLFFSVYNQVFIMFARHQVKEEDLEKKGDKKD